MRNKAIWKEFLFTDIFNIKDGYYNKKPPFDGGNIPFLGASLFNNAVTGFVSEKIVYTYDKVGNKNAKDMEKRIFDGNCIAIVNNGTAVGKAYYQKHSFTCSHDVTPVYLKEQSLTFEIALFLIPLIEKSGEPFKYANKWRPKRIRRSKIMLPVNESGNPDWNFMSDTIREKLTDFDDIQTNSLKKNDILDFRGLNDVTWKAFSIAEIATISGGKDFPAYQRKEGLLPFIGSSSTRNGITDFMAKPSINRNAIEENALSVNRNGSVGYSFYHPYMAYFSGDTRVVKLKQYSENKYINLFVKTSIMQQKEKYGYGYKMGTNRLSIQPILLPADEEGNPDWHFMEQYMKRMENKIIDQINQKEAVDHQ
ncbi:restriction endonuclease subunit S [Bacillus halotolerans]|uniref:restriction endonuclease subunit S n=1 Tax=Bacillus halotolerans TaxID=260554 RepID=UPI002280655F|nr:restriction endonuclease subunit S [Bacillus halotolerans]MCY8474627.1 restriction endonuclease subunit S [Bacillus halotolerans]